jgi:4-hydroxy-3-polyprenylbenzoate decarboxylase
LTIANHLLGKGQTSLAKYLFIACAEDDPGLSTHAIPEFFMHLLSRIDLNRDLHFQTKTTIDTLDYSGDGWNAGSKLVMAARGPVKRNLSGTLPTSIQLPSFCKRMDIVLPGIIAVSMNPFEDYSKAQKELEALTASLSAHDLESLPLWILTEDSAWMAAHLNNFLWATFTRSQPAKDVYGVNASVMDKHWSCRSPLIIDARIKPHHAPILEPDPEVSKKVDAMFSKGGGLYQKIKGL